MFNIDKYTAQYTAALLLLIGTAIIGCTKPSKTIIIAPREYKILTPGGKSFSPHAIPVMRTESGDLATTGGSAERPMPELSDEERLFIPICSQKEEDTLNVGGDGIVTLAGKIPQAYTDAELIAERQFSNTISGQNSTDKIAAFCATNAQRAY